MNSELLRGELAKLNAIKPTDPEWSPFLGPAVMAGNTLAANLDHHTEYLKKKKAAPEAKPKP